MFCYLEGYPMMILGNYHAVLRELLLTKNTLSESVSEPTYADHMTGLRQTT